jgi:hypothetical protein
LQLRRFLLSCCCCCCRGARACDTGHTVGVVDYGDESHASAAGVCADGEGCGGVRLLGLAGVALPRAAARRLSASLHAGAAAGRSASAAALSPCASLHSSPSSFLSCACVRARADQANSSNVRRGAVVSKRFDKELPGTKQKRFVFVRP